MNAGALLVILLLVFSVMGMPICFSLGIATIASLVYGGMPTVVLAQKTMTGRDSVALLAIPFFMLAGNLMSGSPRSWLMLRTASSAGFPVPLRSSACSLPRSLLRSQAPVLRPFPRSAAS